jgi:phosphate transport system ATP-binding protein
MTQKLIKTGNPLLYFDRLNIQYDTGIMAVKNVSAGITGKSITAIMGPSGCGKSTLLRAVNRMLELYANVKITGKIYLQDSDIFSMNPMHLRRRIGMVFQQPNPFPTMSISDNVLAGFLLNRISLKKPEREEIVERSLRNVSLWDEVKDYLNTRPNLSGGQQQRLCIARALAGNPEIILMDEPTSALDPIATSKIEDLLVGLKEHYTIILVTHNMSQAARISDHSMFMYMGELVEYGETERMFTNPVNRQTEEYLTGKFG